MSFDINTARTAIKEGNVTIKKWEGITHALMRCIDSANASKGTKELEQAFRALDATSKKAIMELAREVGNQVPFASRQKNKKYSITDITKIGEKLSINAKTKETPEAKTKETPEAKPAEPKAEPTLSNNTPFEDSERKKVQELISTLAWNSASVISNMRYIWWSMILPQQALVRQPDGEYFLWDTPTSAGRDIYRLNANKDIIGMIRVEMNGTVVSQKWSIGNVAYAVPTQIKTK